jgi:hypothetical protein
MGWIKKWQEGEAGIQAGGPRIASDGGILTIRLCGGVAMAAAGVGGWAMAAGQWARVVAGLPAGAWSWLSDRG